jgi:hypothetical protein
MLWSLFSTVIYVRFRRKTLTFVLKKQCYDYLLA